MHRRKVESRLTRFMRGLAVGALVGAAIAGWVRHRPAATRHKPVEENEAR